MRSYVLDTEVITDDMQLFLYGPLRQREDDSGGGNAVFQTVELDKLVERHRDGEVSGFACFLLGDGKTVSVSVFHNIVQPEFQNIGDAQTKIGFQHKSCGDTLIGAASCKACSHGRDDLLVLFER